MKNFIWNYRTKSVRGSFVNLYLTVNIMMLITIGAFSDKVADNLTKMAVLITTFFAASIGIWSYKKVKEHGKEET